MTTIPLDDQIAEVARELALRKHVYPKFVAGSRMSQVNADKQTTRMEAVLETLIALAAMRAAMDKVGK